MAAEKAGAEKRGLRTIAHVSSARTFVPLLEPEIWVISCLPFAAADLVDQAVVDSNHGMNISSQLF
jgi:hypothetical protein